ncbi:MAG: murein L,D-transpeptidase catalytic domain family protein [Cyclobacteriaceae bacterium]|nr:murein L,D-transpeptidase catalytic domain family protein [Cyclobacteriaceae bacterium]
MQRAYRNISLGLVGTVFTLVLSSFHPSKISDNDPLAELTITLYQSINFEDVEKPEFDLFQRTMIGYYQLTSTEKISNKNIITIIDFRKSSIEKRMWTIDLVKKRIVFHSLVAHGRNTGDEYARYFSNVPNSNQSSLGFFTTGITYIGKHGISLVLHGMEPGINDQAQSRAIVMHGAAYVSEQYIKKVGRLGRSFGCPAVPMESYKEIIPTLAGGTLLFIYYPDQAYHQKTAFHNAVEATRYLTTQSNEEVTNQEHSY